MTINAGSYNPIDHSEDRDTGVTLGSKDTVKVKKKGFWRTLFKL